MIRRLEYRCWFFDCGPWEQPHFRTEAAALADEADAAGADDREPRPVQHRAGQCWVAECDRCERPAGDSHDEWGIPVHHDSETALCATLTDEGWAHGEGRRVYCADCRASGPARANIQRVTVTINGAGSPREVLGELTACPWLVIVPVRSEPDGEVWLGLRLVHRPTGRYLLTGYDSEPVGVLHRVAQLLADLEWSSPEIGHSATGYAGRVRAAYHQASEQEDQAAAQRTLHRWSDSAMITMMDPDDATTNLRNGRFGTRRA